MTGFNLGNIFEGFNFQLMNKKLVYWVFILLLSCNSHQNNNQNISSIDPVKTESTPPLDFKNKSYKSLDYAKSEAINDTSQYFLINQECALYIQPDTSWINAQQRSMPEDDWNTIVDDHQYYESIAEDTLKSYGVNVINRDGDKRFLKFVLKNNSVYTLDKLKMKDAWGLILFNEINDPVLWGGSEINDALKDVYKK